MCVPSCKLFNAVKLEIVKKNKIKIGASLSYLRTLKTKSNHFSGGSKKNLESEPQKHSSAVRD